MVLGWQALDAKKTDKPFEQGRALKKVAARIERVMGLTSPITGAGLPWRVRLIGSVRQTAP